MKYTVLNSMTLEDIVAKVNDAIAQGWQPTGGFWAGPRGFYQPMTKPAAAAEKERPAKAS